MQVYLLTNDVNGKYYVGKTVQSGLRRYLIDSKRWPAENGKNRCMPIVNAIAKYGFDAFTAEGLAVATDAAQLDDLERLWIIALDARNSKIGYNICAGGGASRLGLKNSPEHNRRISESNTGRTPAGYVRTAEHRRQLHARMLNGGGTKAGKLGGKRAGELRMQNFTPEQRKATARTAAAARWGRVGTR